MDDPSIRKLMKISKSKKAGFSGKLKNKIKDGVVLDEKSIIFYVNKKISLEKLSPSQIIPLEIDGIKTDVIETGPMKALGLDPKKYYRPVPAGVSAIYNGGTACTLGWFARDKTDNKIIIIANNHCTSAENKNPVGHPYMQTSPHDSDYGAVEQIGTLKRWVEIKYMDFSCEYRDAVHRLLWRLPRSLLGIDPPVNRVDLGIIDVVNCEIKRELLNIGTIMGKRRGEIGEVMEKMGRTTGYTKGGELIDDDYYGAVSYGRGNAYMGPCGLIKADNFSAGGDSSSTILCEVDKSFAGLLFAGSDTHTIFCHFDFIEEDGNLELVW